MRLTKLYFTLFLIALFSKCGFSQTCSVANYVVKSTGPATTCSEIFDNGSNVGIGSNTLGFGLVASGSYDITPRTTVFTPGGNAGFLLQGGYSGGTGYWPDMGFALVNSNDTPILGASIQGVIISNTTAGEKMDLAFTTKPSTGAVSERMRITNAGYVGIGTSTPGAQLDVSRISAGTVATPIGINILNADKPSSSGSSYGVQAVTNSSASTNTNNYGVSATGQYGRSLSCGVYGVGGYAHNLGSYNYGGEFFATQTDSTLRDSTSHNIGVYGYAYGSYGVNYGVWGQAALSHPRNCAGYFSGDVYTTSSQYFTSDEKLKTNIKDFTNALALLSQVDVKTYDFKYDEYKHSINLPQTNQIGVIAQNLQKVFPNLVKEKASLGDVDPVTNEKIGQDINLLAVNYDGLIPVLVAAVKELNAKATDNADLKAQLDSTKLQLATTNALIADMQKQMNDMCNNGCYALKGTGSNTTDPANNTLLQNNPNPFSGQTTIGYVINSGTNAVISINSLDGQLLQQIPVTAKGAGQITINSSNISAGTYTYSLTIDGTIIDTKIMVITANK